MRRIRATPEPFPRPAVASLQQRSPHRTAPQAIAGATALKPGTFALKAQDGVVVAISGGSLVDGESYVDRHHATRKARNFSKEPV